MCTAVPTAQKEEKEIDEDRRGDKVCRCIQSCKCSARALLYWSAVVVLSGSKPIRKASAFSRCFLHIAPAGCNAQTAARACVMLRFSGDSRSQWSQSCIDSFTYLHGPCFSPKSKAQLSDVWYLNAVTQKQTQFCFYHEGWRACSFRAQDWWLEAIAIQQKCPEPCRHLLTVNHFDRAIEPHRRRHSRKQVMWCVGMLL